MSNRRRVSLAIPGYADELKALVQTLPARRPPRVPDQYRQVDLDAYPHNADVRHQQVAVLATFVRLYESHARDWPFMPDDLTGVRFVGPPEERYQGFIDRDGSPIVLVYRYSYLDGDPGDEPFAMDRADLRGYLFFRSDPGLRFYQALESLSAGWAVPGNCLCRACDEYHWSGERCARSGAYMLCDMSLGVPEVARTFAEVTGLGGVLRAG